jgi:hypothetical protein
LLPGRDATSPSATPRLVALESRVRTLEARAQLAGIVAETKRPRVDGRARSFRIECPAPWRELGPIGQGLWGCRTPDALPDGFYPNCNVTSASLDAPMDAAEYYRTALRESPLLSAATRLSERTFTAHGRAGYEASFEHDTTGRRLRVLASLFVAERQVYVVTCSAPPEVFDRELARFRAISASFQLEG